MVAVAGVASGIPVTTKPAGCSSGSSWYNMWYDVVVVVVVIFSLLTRQFKANKGNGSIESASDACGRLCAVYMFHPAQATRCNL